MTSLRALIPGVAAATDELAALVKAEHALIVSDAASAMIRIVPVGVERRWTDRHRVAAGVRQVALSAGCRLTSSTSTRVLALTGAGLACNDVMNRRVTAGGGNEQERE